MAKRQELVVSRLGKEPWGRMPLPLAARGGWASRGGGNVRQRFLGKIGPDSYACSVR